MWEAGIDIAGAQPEPVEQFLGATFY